MKKKFRSNNKLLKFFIKKSIYKILNFLSKNRKLTYIIVTLICLSLIGPIILSYTFLAPTNNINKINFDKDNINDFDEAKLYGKLKKDLMGKNYYLINLFEINSIKKQIRFEFPIIKDILIGKNPQNEINIKLTFNNPNLFFSLGTRIIAVYSGEFFDLSRSSGFLSGATLINLPDNLSDLDNFDGFFYKVNEKTLKSQINQIVDFFGRENIADIKYIPGATRTILTLTDKRKYYINNSKDISKQFGAFMVIKDKYADFAKITEMDLGGIQDIIIKKIPEPNSEDQYPKKTPRRR